METSEEEESSEEEKEEEEEDEEEEWEWEETYTYTEWFPPDFWKVNGYDHMTVKIMLTNRGKTG